MTVVTLLWVYSGTSLKGHALLSFVEGLSLFQRLIYTKTNQMVHFSCPYTEVVLISGSPFRGVLLYIFWLGSCPTKLNTEN